MNVVFDNGLSRLVNGDCRDVLADLSAQSVHMVVTSPPYWGLRRYQAVEPTVWGGETGHAHEWGVEVSGNGRHAYRPETSGKHAYEAGELLGAAARGNFCTCGAWRGVLGSEPTPERYVANIVEVFRLVKRVLRDDGTLWLNLGPTMSGSGSPGGDFRDGKGGDDYLRPYNRAGSDAWPAKCMVPIPWMVGLALIQDGWILRSEIIWDKPAPMPESVTDRPTKSHEQILLLVKSNKAQYWTHRDRAGTRQQPVPDYRWVRGDDEAHESWHGAEFDDGQVAAVHPDIGQRVRSPREERTTAPDGWQLKAKGCGCCGGDKTRHWARVNLWESRDYYYDAEAIRESSITNDPRKPYGSDGAWKMDGRDKWQNGAGQPQDRDASVRNARSIWRIAPEPSPEKHYAMYPSGLPRRCILAGTSERGCCPECGAPWVRRVEKSGGSTGESWHDHKDDGVRGQRTNAASKGGHGYKVETRGWAATCAHGGAPVPSTVLDPFAGTATTLAAAQELGRRSIGVELSPDYAAMAARRLGKVSLSFPGA